MWRSYLTIGRSDDLRSRQSPCDGLFAYARRTAVLSSGPCRGRDDRPKLLGLVQELGPRRLITQTRRLDHLPPVNRLAGFLDDNPQFGHELRARPSARGGAVVRADGGRAIQQLVLPIFERWASAEVSRRSDRWPLRMPRCAPPVRLGPYQGNLHDTYQSRWVADHHIISSPDKIAKSRDRQIKR
jgi:hypothetical protein